MEINKNNRYSRFLPHVNALNRSHLDTGLNPFDIFNDSLIILVIHEKINVHRDFSELCYSFYSQSYSTFFIFSESGESPFYLKKWIIKSNAISPSHFSTINNFF